MSSSFHQSDLDLCYHQLSQSPNASVISWLDQCPYPTSPDQVDLTLEEQFFEVGETPQSITAMYSPTKRPRNEGSDEGSGFPIARTPPPPIRRRPDLTRPPLTVPLTTGVDESSQAPSSPRTSQNRSTGSNSRQQKNAVKKVLHLRSFDTPVRYRPLDEEVLPIAMKALVQTIAAVSDSQGGIFPNQTKGQDVQRPEKEKDADLFSNHVHAVLMEIVSATKGALEWNRSESAWTLLVHYPMLKLAISGLPNIDVELITTAQMLPAFLPKLTPPTTTRSTSKLSTEAAMSQGKMVDLALLLWPKPISSSILAAAMDSLIPTLPLDECCLSQTDYGPLSTYPAPVAIETKMASGNMEEARIQLGIWTSAWFLRMHKLIREPKTTVMAVPVIMVQGPWWFAYFACETEQGIVLHGPQRLGETNTSYGIYTLLACLKSIGEWLDGPFKQWFSREILGLAKLD